MIEIEEAQGKILAEVEPLGLESLPVREAAGRILRENVASEIDLPRFDNSAMDGYAVQAADLKPATSERPVPLRLLGQIPAGGAFEGKVSSGTCVRLFTGSPLPRGADAIVMQEETRVSEVPGVVAFAVPVAPWENVRFRGEDIKQGDLLAAVGDRLHAGQIAALASVGRSELRVGIRPRVGLISTGNELREAGEELGPSQIYESNRASLASLVSAAGGIPVLFPLVRDDLVSVRDSLLAALNECDAVITSGGVSVGEWDFVKAAIESAGGRIEFWRVAMKPGKPFVFAKHQGKVIFGLPGNPVSAFVTFLLLVRPAILVMQGARDWALKVSSGELREPISNSAERRHFMRVRIDDQGLVHSAGLQGSHAVSSLARANALLDVPPGTTWPSGQRVRVMPWD